MTRADDDAGGPAVVGFPKLWGLIGNGTAFGIALPLIVFLAVAALAWFTLARTAFGITLALIGTNARAAAFAEPLPDAVREQMEACIAERFEALELDAVADLWAAFPASE